MSEIPNEQQITEMVLRNRIALLESALQAVVRDADAAAPEEPDAGVLIGLMTIAQVRNLLYLAGTI